MSRISKKPASEPDLTDPDSATVADPEVERQRWWGRLLAWQARREHSRHELLGKLQRAGAPLHLLNVDALLDRLAELGLQDDQRTASLHLRQQLARGRGQRAIRQKLQQTGLEQVLEPEALAGLDWVAQATDVLRRRFGDAPASDDRERARRVRFLQYRGFSLSQALAALRMQGDLENDATGAA